VIDRADDVGAVDTQPGRPCADDLRGGDLEGQVVEDVGRGFVLIRGQFDSFTTPTGALVVGSPRR
jgi:hypothetical protein